MRWLCARPDPGRTRRGGALPPSSRRSAQPRATDRDTCTGAVPPGPGETRRERGPAPSQTARHSRQRHGRVIRRTARAGRNPAGRGPALSLSLLARARHCRQRYGRDTRIKRCAARAGWDPAGEGPCSLPLAAWHGRQRHGRDTRARRCAARAGRDPAGRGPAPSLSLLGTADSPMAATHAQGGARLQPGETRRGRALLSSLSLSAEPTASRPRRTHRRCAARAGRDQAGEGSALSLLLLGISLLC